MSCLKFWSDQFLKMHIERTWNTCVNHNIFQPLDFLVYLIAKIEIKYMKLKLKWFITRIVVTQLW